MPYDRLPCQLVGGSCPPSLLRLFSLWESKLVAREQGRYPIRNSECGIRNSLLSFFHSAFRNRHSAFKSPPAPRNDARLMVFARNALASGPGNAYNSIHLFAYLAKSEGGQAGRWKNCPQALLKIMILRGGIETERECNLPWEGMGSAGMPPKFPQPLPPYSPASLFNISRQKPSRGTPMR